MVKWSHLNAFFIAVGDRMFLGMQNFDFCLNLIKFYPNFIKFIQILLKFAQTLPKFCPN